MGGKMSGPLMGLGGLALGGLGGAGLAGAGPLSSMLGGLGKSMGIGGGAAAPAVTQAAGAGGLPAFSPNQLVSMGLPLAAAAMAPVTGGASLAAAPALAGAAGAGGAAAAPAAAEALGNPLGQTAMQGLNAMGAGPQAANPYLQAMGGAGMPQGLAAQSMQRGFTDYMRDPQAGQAALQAATPSTQQVPQSGISGGDIAKAGLGMLSGGPYATGGGFAGGDATNAIAQNPILAAQRARQQQAQAAGAPRQGGGGGPATPAVSQVP